MRRHTSMPPMVNSRRRVDIRALSISEGGLPRRATELVLDWAELMEDWNLCQAKQQPRPIATLK